MRADFRNLKGAVAAGVAAALLAGCATDTMTYDGSSKVARNEVELVRVAHEVSSGEDGLVDKDAASLERFLQEMQVGYGDTVTLVAGPAFPETARESVQRAVNAWGIPLAGSSGAIAESPADDGAFVIVDRYVVTPPHCPNATLNANRNYANAFSPQHGCAMVINLGQMVADPRDLLAGRGDSSPVTEKATQAIRLWREDEPEFLEPENIDDGLTGFGETGGGGGG